MDKMHITFICQYTGTIDRMELQAGFLALGLQLDRAQVVKLMDQYQDEDDDDKDTLNEKEFTKAVKEWSRTILSTRKIDTEPVYPTPQPKSVDVEEKEEDESLLDNDTDTTPGDREMSPNTAAKDELMEHVWNDLTMEKEMEEEDEDHFLELSDGQLIAYACAELALGTLLVIIFSDPMVDTIDAFSNTINVSSFYVSFVITPLASNSSEIYSALVFAQKKTQEGISMGFSALYGAACMNNTFVLGIFCCLVYVKQLEWTFVAETLVILFTIIVVGMNGLKPTVTVWQGIPVLILFPLSIGMAI